MFKVNIKYYICLLITSHVFLFYIYAFRTISCKVFQIFFCCCYFIIADAFYLSNCRIVNLERKLYEIDA